MSGDDALAAWRDSGAWRADPVRFRFLESLAARLAQQQPPVRAVLERKLQGALAEFAQIAAQHQPHASAPALPPAICEPLAALNAHLRSASPQPASGELASARRFRRAWDSGRTLDRLQHALDRAPSNAGPLNSHALVVRSLALMGELSTDYLRRFLASADTLQWLEAARQPARAAKAAKPARRSRARK